MASPKVIIITGASKGIGAALVLRLLSQSHKLVLTARSRDVLEEVKFARPDQVEFVAGDMTEPGIAQKVVDTAVKAFGKVDGVIVNHGILDLGKLSDMSLETFKKSYDVNVFSGFAMASAVIGELKKTNGSIVWVSSGAATKVYNGWGAYGSSKAAINHLSAHLASEEPSITSIAIAPGRVNTDMQAVLRATGKESMDGSQYENFVEAFEKGTLLEPEKPGNVIAKLAIEPAKHLSGKFLSWNAPELAAYQDDA
ncbi:hypothetical protein V2G26_016638 [Clonostachys chloroleuca]